MKYVSPEYQQRLDRLAQTLCDTALVGSVAVNGSEQLEIDLLGYAEVADVIIERPDIAQLGKTAAHGFNRNGDYV